MDEISGTGHDARFDEPIAGTGPGISDDALVPGKTMLPDEEVAAAAPALGADLLPKR